MLGGSIDGGREAESAANDECQRPCAGVHLFLEIFREAYGGVFFAVLIEEHHLVGLFYLFQYQQSLFLFYLFG